MGRLPPVLQPAWPLFKAGHRAATRVLGTATRRLPGPEPRPPRRGSPSSALTASEESATVRRHVCGAPEQLRRAVPAGSPAARWVFERWCDFDVPERFVLELDDGLVVGDYAAHVTSSGTLDYETSTYFGVSGWTEHPVFLRPRLPAPHRVDGTVVSLATRGSHGNYYHFLLDVLPRWGVLQECLPGRSVDALFVNRAAGYQRQLLALLGLDGMPAIEPGRDVAVQARELVVPCIPNPELMAPTWTTTWLKESLPARRSTGRPRRLYVTRGTARNTRRVVNEAAVVDVLARAGFEVFDPGQHSVQEQIDHFSAADVVVAPHGAALANLVFAHPGLRVLELFAPRYVNPCYWAIASNIPGGIYHYLVCGTDRRGPGAPQNGVLSDITVDPDDLRTALDALLRA